MPQSIPRAILFLSIAALLFASTGAVIRVLSADVVTEVVVFYRNAIGLLLFVPIVLKHKMAFFKTQKIGSHLFRSLVGMSAMYAFFYAIAHYSLAEAMLFVYASPIFVPLVAHFILKEVATLRHYAVAGLGLLGIAVVFDVSVPSKEMVFIGMFCTAMSAMAFVVVRKLSFTEPAERVVFYFTFFGTCISIVPLLLVDQHLTLFHYGLLLLVGLLTTTAQWFLTKGYALAPAGRVTPASYLTVVFAGVYGWFFWDEVPTMLALIGYTVVFLAVLLAIPRRADSSI